MMYQALHTSQILIYFLYSFWASLTLPPVAAVGPISANTPTQGAVAAPNGQPESVALYMLGFY